MEDTDTMRSHWFAGDGMLHSLCLSKGELFYSNRFTKTEKFNLEMQTGEKVAQIQDWTEVGVLLVPIKKMLIKLKYISERLKSF